VFKYHSSHVQQPTSERSEDLPTWADWSWNEVYLPQDVHVSYATLVASLKKLKTFPISGAPSAMPVVLGIGLLYRESKRVIEYEEDEADPNTPFYLPGSAFDLNFLVSLDDAVREVLQTIVGHIENVTREAFNNDWMEVDYEGDVGLKETEMLIDDNVVVEKEVVNQEEEVEKVEKEKGEDEGKDEEKGEEKGEKGEEKGEKGEEEEEEEEEVVMPKGRKRRIPQASSSKFKKPRTEPEVRRSGRARQPSKRAQM
jgi:hypothetical protein